MDVFIIFAPVLYDTRTNTTTLPALGREALLAQLKDGQWVESLKHSLLARDPATGVMQVVNAAADTGQPEPLVPVRRRSDVLSPRETEVLTLIAKGFSQKAIAQMLELSPSTIGTYRKEIYRKLEISTAAEAALEAVKQGLVNVDNL